MNNYARLSARTIHRPACVTLAATLSLCAVLFQPAAQAQTPAYPTKPITLIVGFPPGGSNDIVARIIAQPLGEALGTTVIVENKSGASGTIAGLATVRAAPDGHTLLAASLSPVIVAPQTYKKPPFNTPTDLIAINMVGLTPETIAVGPSLPGVLTRADLIALSTTRQITMSSSGSGSFPHLAIELLTTVSKGNFLHIPYKGATPAISDTVAGHVDSIMMDAPPIIGMVMDGRLRALAVTSAKRLDALPDVPTAQETLPGFDVVNWIGVFAPAKTPAPIVARINAALVKVIARPDVRAQLDKVAVPPAIMESPVAFQQFVDAEYKRWGDVLKQARVELTE